MNALIIPPPPLWFHTKITEVRFPKYRCGSPSSHLASPGLSSTTPDKALVYDAEVLFPIIHLVAAHMGAPGGTHDRQNIQLGWEGGEEKSPGGSAQLVSTKGPSGNGFRLEMGQSIQNPNSPRASAQTRSLINDM